MSQVLAEKCACNHCLGDHDCLALIFEPSYACKVNGCKCLKFVSVERNPPVPPLL